MSRLHMTN
ncbi:hypothetical protein AZE42_09811, partial [Rhizopogon vesiculosus]